MLQTRDDDCLDHSDHSAHGKKWVDLRYTGRETQLYFQMTGMWDVRKIGRWGFWLNEVPIYSDRKTVREVDFQSELGIQLENVKLELSCLLEMFI